MSTAVRSPTPVRHYGRVVRHFASTRWVEVCALQASPLLGAHLGGLRLEASELLQLAVLLLGSTALTAHVFVFNDWAGYSSDALDPRRALLADEVISREQIAHVSIALLLVAGVAVAAVGVAALLFGAAIAALSLVYSCSPRLGKSTPVAATLNHLVGGSLHFLLGYTLVHAVDARGIAISLFFGLVFAAGHLNQEVRDFESDLASEITTSAVAFGPRRAFLASCWLFTAAYLWVAVLAALEALPAVLLLSAIAWLLHADWAAEALRRGLGPETAAWTQRRYRLLFAVVGVAMLVG